MKIDALKDILLKELARENPSYFPNSAEEGAAQRDQLQLRSLSKDGELKILFSADDFNDFEQLSASLDVGTSTLELHAAELPRNKQGSSLMQRLFGGLLAVNQKSKKQPIGQSRTLFTDSS